MSAIDLTGIRVNKLVVLQRATNVGRQPAWDCQCDCGGAIRVLGMRLRGGGIFDCGCGAYDRRSASATKHGLRHTKEYGVWKSMRERCTNPTAASWAGYGGRGITVCDRWSCVANFVADMGLRPSPRHSLDRIDNSLGYSPDNCRWATQKEQANNTRANVQITIDGATRTLKQWAEHFGVDYAVVKERRANGRDGIDLFTASPRRTYKRRITHAGLSLSVTEWAKHLGAPYITVWQRINLANKNPDGSMKESTC